MYINICTPLINSLPFVSILVKQGELGNHPRGWGIVWRWFLTKSHPYPTQGSEFMAVLRKRVLAAGGGFCQWGGGSKFSVHISGPWACTELSSEPGERSFKISIRHTSINSFHGQDPKLCSNYDFFAAKMQISGFSPAPLLPGGGGQI